MLPRRRRERPVINTVMEEEMRQLRAILDTMETLQRREHDVGDVSESENKYVEEEEVVGEQAVEERLLRVVVMLGTRAKIEVLMYEGNLNVE
jgi:hypothetical protein